MVASWGPWDWSATVSFSGKRVALMRARRSWSSASENSKVNGRIAFDAEVSDMWGFLLTVASGFVPLARPQWTRSVHADPGETPGVGPMAWPGGASERQKLPKHPKGNKVRYRNEVPHQGDRPMSVPFVDSQVTLWGRDQEMAALERMLATARAGSSAVLVIRGEPGIGKTALLDYAAGRAVGSRTVAVAGIESEMELPFAGLHQLCAPMLGGLRRLPGPQRDALSVAFGLQEGQEGEAPSRFLVGLAVIGLLAGAAADRPLACLVDDAQWLDDGSLQVLAFVARRLIAEPVALIFALRDFDGDRVLAGLPELIVERLSEPDARALLASAVRVPLDPLVRDRIVAEAHG